MLHKTEIIYEHREALLFQNKMASSGLGEKLYFPKLYLTTDGTN